MAICAVKKGSIADRSVMTNAQRNDAFIKLLFELECQLNVLETWLLRIECLLPREWKAMTKYMMPTMNSHKDNCPLNLHLLCKGCFLHGNKEDNGCGDLSVQL